MSISAMSHAKFRAPVKTSEAPGLQFYGDVYASEFDVTCPPETWLKDFLYDHSLFSKRHTVYGSDRPYNNKARGGGV
jgi:hypothetical protein